MNAADRRMEIISALMHRHHSTMVELAWEFGVYVQAKPTLCTDYEWYQHTVLRINWRKVCR